VERGERVEFNCAPLPDTMSHFGVWESFASSIPWMTGDITNNLRFSHCCLFTMALKGMEPAPNPQ